MSEEPTTSVTTDHAAAPASGVRTKTTPGSRFLEPASPPPSTEPDTATQLETAGYATSAGLAGAAVAQHVHLKFGAQDAAPAPHTGVGAAPVPDAPVPPARLTLNDPAVRAVMAPENKRLMIADAEGTRYVYDPRADTLLTAKTDGTITLAHGAEEAGGTFNALQERLGMKAGTFSGFEAKLIVADVVAGRAMAPVLPKPGTSDRPTYREAKDLWLDEMLGPEPSESDAPKSGAVDAPQADAGSFPSPRGVEGSGTVTRESAMRYLLDTRNHVDAQVAPEGFQQRVHSDAPKIGDGTRPAIVDASYRHFNRNIISVSWPDFTPETGGTHGFNPWHLDDSLQEVLKSEGIDVLGRGKSGHDRFSGTRYIEFDVPPDQYEKARKIVDAIVRGEPGDTPEMLARRVSEAAAPGPALDVRGDAERVPDSIRPQQPGAPVDPDRIVVVADEPAPETQRSHQGPPTLREGSAPPPAVEPPRANEPIPRHRTIPIDGDETRPESVKQPRRYDNDKPPGPIVEESAVPTQRSPEPRGILDLGPPSVPPASPVSFPSGVAPASSPADAMVATEAPGMADAKAQHAGTHEVAINPKGRLVTRPDGSVAGIDVSPPPPPGVDREADTSRRSYATAEATPSQAPTPRTPDPVVPAEARPPIRPDPILSVEAATASQVPTARVPDPLSALPESQRITVPAPPPPEVPTMHAPEAPGLAGSRFATKAADAGAEAVADAKRAVGGKHGFLIDAAMGAGVAAYVMLKGGSAEQALEAGGTSSVTGLETVLHAVRGEKEAAIDSGIMEGGLFAGGRAGVGLLAGSGTLLTSLAAGGVGAVVAGGLISEARGASAAAERHRQAEQAILDDPNSRANNMTVEEQEAMLKRFEGRAGSNMTLEQRAEYHAAQAAHEARAKGEAEPPRKPTVKERIDGMEAAQAGVLFEDGGLPQVVTHNGQEVPLQEALRDPAFNSRFRQQIADTGENSTALLATVDAFDSLEREKAHLQASETKPKPAAHKPQPRAEEPDTSWAAPYTTPVDGGFESPYTSAGESYTTPAKPKPAQSRSAAPGV